MADQPPTSGSLPPDKVAALLDSALRARKHGNLAAARALLRVLADEQPGLPQIWLALATVAETRAEQRQALERVAALDPVNPLARRGLARMGAAEAAPMPDTPAPAAPAALAEPAAPQAPPAAEPDAAPYADQATVRLEDDPSVGAAVTLAPVERDREPDARAIRWPLYLVLGAALLAVLVAALLIRGGGAGPAGAAPTAALPGAAPTPAPAGAPTAPLDSARAPELAASPAPTEPPPTALPPTAAPTVTPRPALAIGEVVKEGAWHAVLLRPNDALPLDGSIGAQQPRGRFVLALVAIGNDGAAAARIPADLFELVDQDGNRYPALPAVSTAYLNSYGRGQRGDLSMEDLIPADGGNKSVPLIFDVPAAARQLYLVVKDRPAGWPVGAAQPAGRAPASML